MHKNYVFDIRLREKLRHFDSFDIQRKINHPVVTDSNRAG